MRFIYAEYNIYHNSIEISTFDGYILRIDCNIAEDGLRTTPSSQCALDTLAIDEQLEYARLYLNGNIQMWADAEDSVTTLDFYFICAKTTNNWVNLAHDFTPYSQYSQVSKRIYTFRRIPF